MEEYRLAGDYYELGRQFGSRLDREDRTLQDVSPEPVDPGPEKLRFANECADVIADHAPDLLEELRGLADALGLAFDAVAAVPLAINADPGCSLLAIAGDYVQNGTPLFGRTHDFHPSFREYSKLFLTRPENGLASVGCASTFVGRLDGVNEAGLAIGFSGVPTEEDVPGMMWPVAIRSVLDTCRTVPEAVTFLEAVPHARNVNFLVADATGAIALVEASQGPVITTRPSTGFAVATNQFRSEQARRYQSIDRSPDECSRYRTVERWFESRQDGVDLVELQILLSDPDEGICWRIDPEDDDPRSTIWSWAAPLGQEVAYLARDSPVDTPYDPISIPE